MPPAVVVLRKEYVSVEEKEEKAESGRCAQIETSDGKNPN